MLTYGDSPMAAQVDPMWHDHIAHATLLQGDTELTGADVLPSDYHKPQGFSVTLTIDGVEHASCIFYLLAEGGEIRFLFQPTFWSPGYGALIDEFGIPWEIDSGISESTGQAGRTLQDQKFQ